MSNTIEKQNTLVERPPVVVVMGHIDHGKSSLLDYIRKTKIVDKEAGGITQHVSAYEIENSDSGRKNKRITFLDTPGHEAFRALRSRGAKVADLAILVVSAEDGVKPQTLEALAWILEAKIPYIVAINKIDKPSADLNKTKQSLAENEIYIEGYGGTISAVPISAKTGEGVPELLDIIFLQADLAELKANPNAPAEGIVIESNLDPKKGISATLIIKNGILNVGKYLATENSFTPVRSIENSQGGRIMQASFSSPVTIVGWNKLVNAGSVFKMFDSKELALNHIEQNKIKSHQKQTETADLSSSDIKILPVVVKADSVGSVEAILHEIDKLKKDRIAPKIILSGVGPIGEGDIKVASAYSDAVVVGFQTKIDPAAKILAERDKVTIQLFDIIYKLTEWLNSLLVKWSPKIRIEESTGSGKILKIFSKQKDKQIIGVRVEEGFLGVGEMFKILRRESEIGIGKIRGLQQQKQEVSEVKAGEFGALVESKIEIVPGDYIKPFRIVEK